MSKYIAVSPGFPNKEDHAGIAVTAEPLETEEIASWSKGELQPQEYRDKNYAIAFFIHLCIVGVGAVLAPPFESRRSLQSWYYDGDDDASSYGNDAVEESFLSSDVIISSIALAIVTSLLLTLAATTLIRNHGVILIKSSLFTSLVLLIILGVRDLLRAPQLWEDEDTLKTRAGIHFFFALVMMCYSYAVWNNIPFAASTMRSGVTALQENLGVFCFAFFSPLIKMVIFYIQIKFFWAVFSTLSNEDSLGIFSLCLLITLSFYWTNAVVKNISTVSAAGTVGTWWFTPSDANSFFSSAVTSSFRRAMTYSFGSICLGSLVVAILQILVDYFRRLQRNRACIMLICIIQCILIFLESLMEYFNKWAFVYVGLYGYDYRTAGKNVFNLFKSRGWTSILSHNLVQRCLWLISICIGLITGGIVALLCFTEEQLKSENKDIVSFGTIFGFYTGTILAVITSYTLLEVVGSSSDTVIVCFAEGAAEFETNHPLLHAEMTATFSQAFPNFDTTSDSLIEQRAVV